MSSVKYPRTWHMPFSPGYSFDDEQMNDLQALEDQSIVITEKMDGENTTLYRNHWHARGLDSRRKHESRDWLANHWASFKHNIPEHWRICGENLYARHSIFYDNLQSLFYGISVWNEGNVALSWDATKKLFGELQIVPVPVLYEGPFSYEALTNVAARVDLRRQEGFVVRYAGEIPYHRFHQYVAKWVRPNHVQPDKGHWFSRPVTRNVCREKSNVKLQPKRG